MSIITDFSIDHFKCRNAYLHKLIFLENVSGIHLNKFDKFDDFLNSLSFSVKRDFKQKKKYNDIKIINISDYIEDFFDINHSSSERQGRKMDSEYLKTKEYYYEKYKNIKSEIICEKHFYLYFGLFINNKLVCYINLIRDGNIIGYSQILGHYDYLKFNIMTKLHLLIIEWIFKNLYKNEENLYLIYANYSEGTSLQNWKNRHGFEKFQLNINENEKIYAKLFKYKNKYVSLEIINNDLKITSLQNISTPGFKNKILINGEKKIRFNIENPNNVKLMFYYYHNKKKILIDNLDFDIDIDLELKELEYGIFFVNPKIGDFFIIKNINIFNGLK